MTSTPTAPGVIRQADVHHEPSGMGNGLLNHDPAAVARIRRGVMEAVRWEGAKRQIRQISQCCGSGCRAPERAPDQPHGSGPRP